MQITGQQNSPGLGFGGTMVINLQIVTSHQIGLARQWMKFTRYSNKVNETLEFGFRRNGIFISVNGKSHCKIDLKLFTTIFKSVTVGIVLIKARLSDR